jgi:regulator of protease activity HflC (stomatin/prohibitin superfamily)
MDYEHYTRLITAINDQLQAIADLTAAQALTGCAESSNPAFVGAMNAHKRLTDLSAKMTAQMLTVLDAQSAKVGVNSSQFTVVAAPEQPLPPHILFAAAAIAKNI